MMQRANINQVNYERKTEMRLNVLRRYLQYTYRVKRRGFRDRCKRFRDATRLQITSYRVRAVKVDSL